MEDVRGELSDLAAKVAQLAARPVQSTTLPVQSSPQSSVQQVPFWDITVCEGLTLTTGISDNWDVRFDVTTATNWRKRACVTACGELDFGMTLWTTAQARAVLTWDAAQAKEIKCDLTGYYVESEDFVNSSPWNVQLNFNGKVTEYTTYQAYVTLTTREGRNRLAISWGVQPTDIKFGGMLFDVNQGDSWVDPRTIAGYLR